MTTLEKFINHPLNAFLEARKLSKEQGREATLTGMGEISGSWKISDKDYPTLLDLLNDYLFVKGNRALGFVEQPSVDAPKPILKDLDFRYPIGRSLNHTFSTDHIRKFCTAVKDALGHFFELNQYESLRFFVSLRPQAYQDKGQVKDGIHVECPDMSLSNEKWKVVRRYLLARGIISQIFGDTGYSNRDEDVYDEAMGRKQGWIFYGASKKSTIPAYQLTHILTYSPETDIWTDEPPTNYTSRQILELLSIRYQVVADENEVRPEVKEEFDMLSRSSGSALAPEPTATPELTPAEGPTVSEYLLDEVQASIPTSIKDDDMRLIRSLVLECLSQQRSDRYETWIRVGWCLHNISPSEDFFDLWMEFSKKSSKYQYNNVGNLRRDWFGGSWRKDGDGPRLTIRSLYRWAKEDDQEAYNRIIDENITEYINTNVDATHFHIARLMKKMYGSTFIASVGNRATEWFMYDENKNMWKHLNQGMDLRKKICMDVAEKMQSACTKVRMRWVHGRNDDERTRWANKLKSLHEMEMKLYNSGFNDSVMKMAINHFYEEDFASKLNMDPYLVGCSNGILELRHRQVGDTREHVIFRQGRPEDYVSFLVGQNGGDTAAIPYHPYNPEDPLQKEIQDFLRLLFPRAELRTYVLRLLASCLEGCNREQRYYFFIGVGSNGKSKLVELMRLTLGDYQTSLQTTALTRKRPESGAANPDIIAMKARRFIYSQEPDDREPLNTSRMKQLSGEDIVEARGLFQDQEKFKIMGKMFMMCNRLPPVYQMDNGTWRRIRVIPFESRFEPEEHPDVLSKKPNVHVRDNFLDTKLVAWREAFLALLVHIYETEYIPFGLNPEPLIVKQESEKYKENFDSFAKFRNDRFREFKNGYEELAGEKVDFKMIQRCFKRWMSDQMGTAGKGLTPKELMNKCVEAFGEPSDGKTFLHIRVFAEEEEVEDFDKQHATLTAENLRRSQNESMLTQTSL